MKKTLAPIVHRDRYTDEVVKDLVAYVEQTLYDPLFDLLKPDEVRRNENKEFPNVWDALLAGVIWYASEMFMGRFDAAISRELRQMGATKRGENFYLPVDRVPLVLRGALAVSAANSKSLHETVLVTLAAMQLHIDFAPTGLAFTDTVDSITEDLQEQLIQTVSDEEGLSPPLATPASLSEELRADLTRQTDRSIKSFIQEQISALRAKVRDNLSEGGRIDRLIRVVEADFGIAKRRARSLAESGVSALVSAFRLRSYGDLGATQYLWETSHDERVRPDHAALNGRVFAWSSPPIADRATGFRGHPGEAANCRCVARPIIFSP